MDYQQAASLRPRKAAQFLGIGETTLWQWAKDRADFPKPIKLGPRTTVWELDKLIAWRNAQAQAVQ
jgi:prophage regulatory protein